MTFYQELQLNQAGSKNLLKKSETVKEKSYHILVYYALWYFGMRIWGSTPDNLRCFWLCSL